MTPGEEIRAFAAEMKRVFGPGTKLVYCVNKLTGQAVGTPCPDGVPASTHRRPGKPQKGSNKVPTKYR